jgi:UDP-glucose 4-epimerase
MRLLLTGGAGYVGSACLRWLLAHGHDPIAYDNLCEGNPASVPDGRLVKGDLADLELLTRTLRDYKAEGVMHFAAIASVPESIKDPESYWRINVQGTKNVLDAMRDAGVWRVVFSSTAATYGFHGEMPLREDALKLPETPYGETKLAGEWLLGGYARAYGIGYAAMRYFNAAGADLDGSHGEHRRTEGHLIPLTLMAALGKREKLLIYGSDYETRDGTCLRDYVHTADLAQAHQLAIEKLEAGKGRAYNLGSGTGATVLEVLRACEAAADRPIPHEFAPRRPGDPGVLVASPDRAIKELGWSPRHSDLKTIVESAWKWHTSHPNGYE